MKFSSAWTVFGLSTPVDTGRPVVDKPAVDGIAGYGTASKDKKLRKKLTRRVGSGSWVTHGFRWGNRGWLGHPCTQTRVSRSWYAKYAWPIKDDSCALVSCSAATPFAAQILRARWAECKRKPDVSNVSISLARSCVGPYERRVYEGCVCWGAYRDQFGVLGTAMLRLVMSDPLQQRSGVEY